MTFAGIMAAIAIAIGWIGMAQGDYKVHPATRAFFWIAVALAFLGWVFA